MAHWIIEDKGFGGQWFRCSECGYSYNDTYEDHAYDEPCPGCGAVINDDENEYISNKPKLKCSSFYGAFLSGTSSRSGIWSGYRKLEEEMSKLEQVSGYSLGKLIELFAAGYTLQPPEYKSMTEALKDMM